jgi:hypothetical protein
MMVLEGQPARLGGIVLGTSPAVGVLRARVDVLVLLGVPDRYGGIALGLISVSGIRYHTRPFRVRPLSRFPTADPSPRQG